MPLTPFRAAVLAYCADQGQKPLAPAMTFRKAILDLQSLGYLKPGLPGADRSIPAPTAKGKAYLKANPGPQPASIEEKELVTLERKGGSKKKVAKSTPKPSELIPSDAIIVKSREGLTLGYVLERECPIVKVEFQIWIKDPSGQTTQHGMSTDKMRAIQSLATKYNKAHSTRLSVDYNQYRNSEENGVHELV